MATKTTAKPATSTAKRTTSRRTTAKAVRPNVPKGTARPKTCGALFAADPKVNAAFAAEGCKRLPRHSGEHRATLHVTKAKPVRKPTAKVAKAPRWTKSSLAAFRTELDAKVTSGDMTPSEALSALARAGDEYAAQARAAKAARRSAKVKAEAAA